MAKENISATVDPDVAEWLDQPGRNKSETINEALKQYQKAGGSERAMIELRLEQLNSRERQLESELTTVREEKETLRERLEEFQEEQEVEREAVFNEALSMLAFEEAIMDNSVIIQSPDEAVGDFAEDADMDLEAFKEELKSRYKER